MNERKKQVRERERAVEKYFSHYRFLRKTNKTRKDKDKEKQCSLQKIQFIECLFSITLYIN